MRDILSQVMELYWETALGDLDQTHAVLCPECRQRWATTSWVWTDQNTGDEHLSALCECGWKDTKELDEHVLAQRHKIRTAMTYAIEHLIDS